MDQVIIAIEQIRCTTDCEVRIDVGPYQERETIAQQLHARLGFHESPESVDSLIESFTRGVLELRAWVTPYNLPEDYLFFIGQYGGLVIHADIYSFQLFGEGPMVEEWYTSPMGDDSISKPSQDGILTIGTVSFAHHTPYEQAYFLLDLAGVIQPNAVLGVPPAASIDYQPEVVVQHLRELPTSWTIVASSFTDFLARAAATKGSLGYC